MSELSLITSLMNKVLSGGKISFEEAEKLLFVNDVPTLARCADNISRTFNGDIVDVETLVNAKSGSCPEDCSFCSQSSFYSTGIDKYPLLPIETIVEHAVRAKQGGANSFCIVCAYRFPPEKDFEQICQTIEVIKQNVKIDVNASLGFMTYERARKLKSVGVKRYNHNLEASESYFSQICKTHDFADRVSTAKIIKKVGLQLCCGGIIGMGESPKQRIELGFSIASLDPNEVPVNILISKKGTPLANITHLDAMDAIRTIAIWRFLMPKTILKLAGGREISLKEKERSALHAGANGIITGGYLTTDGNNLAKDLAMIREIGLRT